MFDRNSTILDRTFLALFWQNHIFDRTFRKIRVWQNSKWENVLSKRCPFRRILSYTYVPLYHVYSTRTVNMLFFDFVEEIISGDNTFQNSSIFEKKQYKLYNVFSFFIENTAYVLKRPLTVKSKVVGTKRTHWRNIYIFNLQIPITIFTIVFTDFGMMRNVYCLVIIDF